ncbi:MAG: hypothetical protein ACI8PQ_002652 [Planctomycetota bacterium]|jgi:hypothetical protein
MGIRTARSTRLAIGLALAALFSGIALVSIEQRALNEMLAAGQRLEELVDAQEFMRAPLYGEETDGSAHDEYSEATRLLAPDLYDCWRAYRAACEAEPGSELHTSASPLRAVLVAGGQASLAALRRGAHCVDAEQAVDWEEGWGDQTIKLMAARNLVNLAVMAAEEHVQAGRQKAAVDVLLDAAQFSADLVQSPFGISQMIGCALLRISTRSALVQHELLRSLPSGELERLAEALAAIDSRLEQRGLAAQAELAIFVRAIKWNDQGDFYSMPRFDWRAYRHAFSSKLQLCSMVEEQIQLQEQFDELAGLSWKEAEALLTTAAQEEDKVGHWNWSPIRLSMEQSLRYSRTDLRLARAAVELRLGNPADSLLDPFGDRLLLLETAEGTWVQSIGPDGRVGGLHAEGLSLLVPTD